MVVALESGGLEFYSLSYSEEEDGEPNFHFLEKTASVTEHDELITAMKRGADNAILTASYDRSVVVVDSNTLALVNRLESAIVRTFKSSLH